MLLIFELLFFVLGISLIISRELYFRLIDFLLEPDKHETSKTPTKLLGMIVLSPLPVSALVSYSLVALLGDSGVAYQDRFRIFYLIAVILASIVIVGKTKTPENTQNGSSIKQGEGALRLLYVSGKMLILLGVVVQIVVVCIAFASGTWLLIPGVISSIINDGFRSTDNFWLDIFLWIFLFTIVEVGIIGIYKIYRLFSRQ